MERFTSPFDFNLTHYLTHYGTGRSMLRPYMDVMNRGWLFADPICPIGYGHFGTGRSVLRPYMDVMNRGWLFADPVRQIVCGNFGLGINLSLM
jgi:hypothetical protein